jgi:hypothetical protein
MSTRGFDFTKNRQKLEQPQHMTATVVAIARGLLVSPYVTLGF